MTPHRVAFVLMSTVLVAATGALVASLVSFVPDALPLPALPDGVILRPQPARPAYPFEPRYAQDGKDVVWIPSADSVVEAMLDVADVTSQDHVIDLGSGDGRTVIAAARRGAVALGIEYDPAMVDLSREAADAAGVGGRASFVQGDIFESNLSRATVVTMFLLPSLNMRLRPALLGLRPGTRIVSNTFSMDDWLPDATARAHGPCEHWCLALLWIVPAKVEGTWRTGASTLTFTRQFQMLGGTLTGPGGTQTIRDGRLRGSEIAFRAGKAHYQGRVDGNVMRGTVDVEGRQSTWSASREGTVRRPAPAPTPSPT